MPWHSFVRSYGALTGKRPRGAVTGHVRYVLRDGECRMAEHVSYGEPVEDRQRILARWRSIYDQETGRVPLEGPGGAPGRPRTGPRGRYDARVMERLAVPLPNSIFDGADPAAVRQRIRQLAIQLSGGSSDVVWALHRGERAGREQNLHLHILFRPRGFDGRKPHVSRAGLQALRRRQLGLITDWVIRMGIEARVPEPSGTPHLGPQKMALAERGILLHAHADRCAARALALANAGRQAAKTAALEAWREAVGGGGMPSMAEAGWRLEQEGGRGTWTLVLAGAPQMRFAVRRLAGIRERDADALIRAMQEEAARAAAPAAECQAPAGQAVSAGQEASAGLAVELWRSPRTGETAVWDPAGVIRVLDGTGALLRTVYVRRVRPGAVDWEAVGRMAVGRCRLGDGDTCGAVALGHDPERLERFVERRQADDRRFRAGDSEVVPI